jgi:phosphate-selective porin
MTIATLILTLLIFPPSFRIRNIFRADLHASVNADVNAVDAVDFGRVRLGVEGKFLKHLQYEVEYDFASSQPWKDVFLDVNRFRSAKSKIGNFKIPFCMDELTPNRALDFVDRTLTARDLAPGRAVGVGLRGRLFNGVVGYQAGAFANDGENSEAKTGVRGKPAYAARVTAEPVKELHLGAAFVTSNVPEGLNSLKEKGAPRAFVSGRRLRLGTEFGWASGPFAIKSEWVHVSEAREGQSIRETDLPERIARGAYLTGAWRISQPIQLAMRFEQVRYRSANSEGMPFSSPRAPTLPTITHNIWTGGVNWFVGPFAKIQFDGVHEGHWTAQMRLQFFM